MRGFIILLIGISCTTCQTTSSQDLTSNWAVLKEAGKVECSTWPMREGEMALDHLAVLDTKPHGFVADIRLRSQGLRHAFATFESSTEIDPDDIATLKLPATAKVWGGLNLGAKSHVVVAQIKAGKTSVDLREFPKNIVQQSGLVFNHPIAAAHVTAGTGSFWLTYKVGNPDKSVEEMPANLAVVKITGNTLSMTPVKHSFNETPAVLVKSGTPGALAVWHDQTETSSNKFKIVKIAEDGTVNGPVPLAVPVNNAVESWAAVSLGDYSLLAYVDGDSMIGQASIKIAKIRWEETVPVVAWVKTRSLSNIHVADPVWVRGKSTAYLLIPQWIDEENTIASYKIGADDIDAMAVSGVFPKGTRVVSGFYDGAKGAVYALTRQRASVAWRYDICHLKEI